MTEFGLAFGFEPPGPRTAELPNDTNDANEEQRD
jgi:hypothetical protein